MIQMHPQYVVDSKQKTKAVILPLKEWEHVLDALEELEDIRVYDEAKLLVSDPIPLSQIKKDME